MTSLDADRIQEALDALEPFSQDPGTHALHDAIYGLFETPTDLSAVERVVASQPDHPGLPGVSAALGCSLQGAPPDLAQVLAAHGPLPSDGDLTREVARPLERGAEVEAVLRTQLVSLERQTRFGVRAVNALSLVAAALAIFALLGWLAALGLWEIPWSTVPAPGDEDVQTTGASTVEPARKP